MTKGRINLVNPPSAPGTVANREGAAGMGTVYLCADAFLYPPQTLATAAATLRNAGYQVRAFDAVVEEPGPDLVRADAVGVFVSYASLDADIAFLKALRAQTSAKLIAFGPAMRFVGKEVLTRTPVDAVLIGEAEGFFDLVLQNLDAEPSPALPKVLTPGDVHSPCCNGEGFIQDLDMLPFPAWDLLPHEKYALLTLLGSRGCPDMCAYCPYVVAQGKRFRARSVENILAELAWLSDRFHPSRLVFRDPAFAYNRERVVALCEGILERKLHVRWECESRPEHFDTDLLRLMKRAGCQWVKIGLETTDGALLQQLRRVGSAAEAVAYLQRVADIVRTCRKIGLHCRVFVMAGLPGQDVSMAHDTRRFVEQIRPTALNIKVFKMYPGIELQADDKGNREAQLEALRQAQAIVNSQHPTPTLFDRGRRWLRTLVRRGRHE